MRDIRYIHVKVLFLYLHLRQNNLNGIPDCLAQVKGLLRQADLPALDLGHVKYFIDQTEQTVIGDRYFVQTFLHARRILNVHRRNGCHSHNRIHRCADIMGHPGKKVAFRVVRLFRRLQRFL